MPTKPIGIEDDETFVGRVGTALSAHARAAVATELVPAGGTAGQVLSKTTTTDHDAQWSDPTPGVNANTPFLVRYTAGAWEFASLPAAQAAGLLDGQTIWFAGPAGVTAPTWARTGDIWMEA